MYVFTELLNLIKALCLKYLVDIILPKQRRFLNKIQNFNLSRQFGCFIKLIIWLLDMHVIS